MRSAGLSDASGLCNTRAMSRPRIWRISLAAQAQQIAAGEENFARDGRALVFQQPQQRQRDGALARSAFAHQAQNLAFADFDFDVAQHARLVGIVHRQARCEETAHR